MPSNKNFSFTKTYPAELKAVLERASQGDLTAMPELKKAFDDRPELVELFGDLVRHAEEAFLTLAAGSCLVAREAIARQAAELRARLAEAAGSELERLLIDRIVISWLEVYHADIDLARHLVGCSGASPLTQAAQKRLDRAHLRFLTAVKVLATVQKLVRPVPSPVEMLRRPVAETTTARAGKGRCTGRVMESILDRN